ncbi:hypothetical protein [Pseudomonas sp. BIC9C]|uniref:hypothetical protein n=1 Tax=Pseudomonas sp. BIC9C TaxID=3078458 RepID=UPI002AD33045|nr:hypothetical protein [Pseudomonas sp. BIC9C]
MSAKLERKVIQGAPILLEKLVGSPHADSVESQPDLGAMPSLEGATQWLNGPDLSNETLRGKVDLVDFWTFDCINCWNSLPYVKQWAERYADQGLVVIGVHTPEYPLERILDNLRKATVRLGVQPRLP